MLAQSETLTFSKAMKSDPEAVYKAFTTAQGLRDWLCNAAEVEPRKGGRFYVWWDDGYYSAGTITELEADKALAFTWRGPTDPSPSDVRVSLAAGDGGTLVEIEHKGIAPGDLDVMRKSWEDGLENLQSVVETGRDLRFVRRPMFGLSGADVLNPELAARLGVPVKEGIWLDGLVEGMGAHKAGFQKNDVMVSLGGKEIANFNDFRLAMDAHRAGDHIEAIFYRGPERHVIDMELSARPIPDMPDTVSALAEQARAMFAEIDGELAALFEGGTDAEADYRPGPGEWSTKEILAHLIAELRDMQTFIAGTVDNADVENVFHANGNERMAAIVSGYPSLSALIEELHREEGITAQQIANLPDKTAANKSFYFLLATWAGNYALHPREHFGIIKGLVEEARKK